MAKRSLSWTRVLSVPASQSYQQSAWMPPADVYRCREGWLVKFELAGVRADQIQLTAQGSTLTVRGARHDGTIAEGQSCYSMEISYNRFQRSITLPCDLSEAQIETEYREGMLLVRVRTGGET